MMDMRFLSESNGSTFRISNSTRPSAVERGGVLVRRDSARLLCGEGFGEGGRNDMCVMLY